MNLKIFTDNIEREALNQIENLLNQSAFKECKVRIMPDVHAGKGCVIGFTADLGNKVIPNIVGVDIGCGMRTLKFYPNTFDLEKLDKVIKRYVPSGRNIHSEKKDFDLMQNLHCYNQLKNIDRLYQSIGTLGGGNHFIEIDKDLEGYQYLIIHTGSRNLGLQVATIYQDIAVKNCDKNSTLNNDIKETIEYFKALGKENEINFEIQELKKSYEILPSIPKEFSYLQYSDMDNYLKDMRICQIYATINRQTISEIILNEMGIKTDSLLDVFETIHNYIDDYNIVRKGAISAKYKEKVLIPLNMRDGCILGYGKGNFDWNYSAPHGAGRLMSRKKAKESYSLKEFQDSMKDVYTTSINQGTLDECPMVYKDKKEIIKNIEDTVEITNLLKPIYNFKAQE